MLFVYTHYNDFLFFIERSIGFITTMENINLRSIRWESIKTVFLSIARTEKISRADISAETDLSLMTVGKVADALMDIDAIEQCKESKNSAGRRAGLLSIKQSIYSVILDLQTKNFACCIMNMRLNPVETIPYHYVDSMSFCENLDRFLRNASSFLSTNYSDGTLIGVGVAIPGTYTPATNSTNCQDLPELDTVDIPGTVSEYFPHMPIVVDSAYNAAAMSHIAQIGGYKEKVIFYWHIHENGVRGAIIPYGKVLHGAHRAAGDFGKVIAPSGATLNSLVKASNSATENAAVLARSIHNVIRLADPDVIILECPLYKNNDDFCGLLKSTLVEECHLSPETLPDIIIASGRASHAFRGLTMRLRESWLHDRIFTKD